MNPFLRVRLIVDRGTWIVPNQVLACSYPRRQRLRAALREHGVTLLVNLHGRRHDSTWLEPTGIREVHLPVPDFTPPSPVQIETALNAIQAELTGGGKVAVHCAAGLGRTGTLLACLLVKEGARAEDAITTVRRLRPGSIETRRQVAAIYHFAEQLRTAHDHQGEPRPA